MITCSNNNDVKTGGHLGNQVMRVMALIGFSIKYNAFALLPDWHYKQYFDIKRIAFTNEASTITNDMFDKIVEREFHYTPDYWDGQNFTKDIDLIGFFQSPKYWPKKLEFKDDYIDFIKGKYGFDDITPVPTLAISVRRGDFVDHPDYYQLGIDYYLGALQTHFPTYTEKGRIYIFSDDIDWCKKEFAHLEHVIFIHASDIEQLALMTLCTDFIISNSTFSYVGAYLSGNGTVIRPKQNFRGKKAQENSEKDYWPAEWIIFDDVIQSKLPAGTTSPQPQQPGTITINDFFDAVFCINLKRRPDRKSQAQQQFDRFGITVQFIEAIDGEFVQIPSGYKPTSADGTNLTANELACTASHLKVAQLAQQRNLRNYFVFEDDAELDNDFVQRFSDYVKQLPDVWDMLYLGGNHKGGTLMVTKKIARIFETYTTHAYGVNKQFYNGVIENLSLKEKADIALSQLHKTGCCYCTIPHLAFQLPSFSDIEGKMVTNNHLRNTNNGGNHNFAYVALDPVSGHVLKAFNYMNTNLELQFVHPQNLINTIEVGTAELNKLFNSGTNIIFLFVNTDLRTADAGKMPELMGVLKPKVAGKCFFITINLKTYEFAEHLENHFEANLNVGLNSNDFAKFEFDIANQLKGYAHTKRFFPV